MSENENKEQGKIEMPSLERIQQELGSATSIDDFFGKGGIFARLFATTLEQMLDAELTAQLGYEKYEAKGRNSGNSRNGKYKRKVHSSGGQVEVAVPRDRAGEFEPTLLKKYETSINELEDKIITLYAKGLSVRDIHDSLEEDMSGLPAGCTGEGVTKGYFADSRNRRGRQLGRVVASLYDEIVVERLYDGKRQLDRSLPELVLAAQAVLDLTSDQRQRCVVRVVAPTRTLIEYNNHMLRSPKGAIGETLSSYHGTDWSRTFINPPDRCFTSSCWWKRRTCQTACR